MSIHLTHATIENFCAHILLDFVFLSWQCRRARRLLRRHYTIHSAIAQCFKPYHKIWPDMLKDVVHTKFSFTHFSHLHNFYESHASLRHMDFTKNKVYVNVTRHAYSHIAFRQTRRTVLSLRVRSTLCKEKHTQRGREEIERERERGCLVVRHCGKMQRKH